MAFFSKSGFSRFKAVLFGLFALAQLTPAGAVIAPEPGGDFKIVICTKDGFETVSWADVAGEPSPYQSHEENSGADACHACAAGACSSGKVHLTQAFLPNVKLMTPVAAIVATPKIFRRINAGPPMPSRAPPLA